jgi:putative hemolysin
MMKTKLLTLGLLACLLLVAGCGSPVSGALSPDTPPTDEVVAETESTAIVEEDKGIGMANPASVYCEEQGGTLDIRDTDAGQYGVCVFPDGSECEEWAFFRGECSPGDSANPTETIIGMANPASVYCEEHGGTLDIRDSDAGQYGMCSFPDGSECEEWAFFRGECGVVPDDEASPETADTVEAVEDWIGVVVSNPEGAQFDDYFQMMDQNGTRVGIAGFGEIGEQLVALRDTGTVIHVWGVIRRDVPDAYGAQIEVTRLEIE